MALHFETWPSCYQCGPRSIDARAALPGVGGRAGTSRTALVEGHAAGWLFFGYLQVLQRRPASRCVGQGMHMRLPFRVCFFF